MWKNKILLCLTIVIIMSLAFLNVSLATNENVWKVPEKSLEFEKWENLKEEQRENSIMPSYFDIKFKDSVKKSKYNALLSKIGNSVGTDYKIAGLTLKDQQATSLCWAFSFSTMLEGTGKGKVYSPAYLDYAVSSSFNKKQGESANCYLAVASAMAGKYPVLETDMPFSSVYNIQTNTSETSYMTPIEQLPSGALEKTIDARILQTREFASIYKEIDANKNITYKNGNGEEYSVGEVEEIREIIKEHIKNNGPISTTMYSDLDLDSNGNVVSEEGYFKIDNNAYFCNNSTKIPNHGITIVGWDDNYEVSNFNANISPKNPGAYIVLNSYGNLVGENGYMYISYEDTVIEQNLMGISKLEEYESEEEITYDKIYQYDELGYNYPITTGEPSIMAANVFSREASKIEYLNEVSTFLPVTQGIEVYVNSEDGNMANLTKVSVETANIMPGYHVVKLSNPVKLTGKKFVVAIKYTNAEVGGVVPLESNMKDSGISVVSNYFDTATSNEEESFISTDNGVNWVDIEGVKIGSDVTLTNTNVCIKAYTLESSEATTINVTGVSLNKERETINVGDTHTLTATVLPKNATNQDVIWDSSNKSVATISDSGVITAISEGTTTITVKTVDGNFTDNCIIEVVAKKDTSDDIYKEGMPEEQGEKDSTLAKTIIPYAGNKIIILISVVLFVIVTIIIYVRYRTLKDVK